MADDRTPRTETRRAPEFAAELVSRLCAWLPEWKLDQAQGDPGRALLDVSARLLAQVAERLDRVAEKNRRNLYSWLGVRGKAARGARLPVVFTLTDSATENVDARSPVQLQADVNGVSLVFETETDLTLVPAKVALVAAVDPAKDAYYLPTVGYASLALRALLPARWSVVSFAGAGSALLQLDPPIGLAPGMIIEIQGHQFRIATVNADIVGVDPTIDVPDGIVVDSVATRVDVFAPFDGAARSLQQHALYFGDTDLLNIESTVQIEIEGARALSTGFRWQYWGKTKNNDVSGWQALALSADVADALVLKKAKAGAIELHSIGGTESRWLRAVSGALLSGTQPISLAGLRVRVKSANTPTTRPELEGMANTNPLVLDSAFFPLGREPRQFDAFYLGCTEVFAKHGAVVKLDFKLADGSFRNLSTPHTGPQANRLLAGVGRDNSLHLLGFDPATGTLASLPQRDGLQPPGTGATGKTALNGEPIWRLPMWEAPFVTLIVTLIAVGAGRSVWVWIEVPLVPDHSNWFGQVGAAFEGQAAALDALVHVPGAGDGTLYALFDGGLFSIASLTAAAWSEIPLAGNRKLKMLAPVYGATGSVHLVAIDDQGGLLAVHDDGQLDPLLPANSASPGMQPVALQRASDSKIVVVVGVPASVGLQAVAFDTANLAALATAAFALAPSPSQQAILGFDFDDGEEGSWIVGSALRGDVSRVFRWAPDYAANSPQDELQPAELPNEKGLLTGSPLRLPHHVLVPGDRAAVFELQVSTTTVSGSAPIQLWAQLPPLIPLLALNDQVTVDRDGIVGLATISEASVVVDGTSHLPLTLSTSALPNPPTGMLGFRSSDPTTLSATIVTQYPATTEIELAGITDLDGVEMILVDGATPATRTLFIVDSVTALAGPGGKTRAVVSPKLGGTSATTIAYRPSIDISAGATVTVMRFDRALTGPPTSIAPNAGELLLSFDSGTPRHRLGKVLTRYSDGRPKAALLTPGWTTLPTALATGEFRYTIEPGPGAWSRPIGPSASNPELSWEYSNGRSWWQLEQQPSFSDATDNLKTSGEVTFDVPADIEASDWSGRTNFWIRARLIGGDYGREVFTVTSTVNGGTTTQSVVRSTEGVRPPVVVSLDVSYAMAGGAFPHYVLAEDAGTFRNQGDANRTPGAEVEAFVPIDVELARLGNGAGKMAAVAPCCDAHTSRCIDGTSEVEPTGGPVTADASTSGPALLIGIEGTAEGPTVTLMFAVGDEHDFDKSAPLKIEALVAGRFEPVVAVDATRAVGESGIVTMSIAHAPSITELFGRSLSWLRVSPSDGADWKPSLAGAWLNAAWVDAAQTQTYEVLGSSQGEPSMTVTLARPPLLADTLELRVAEPLGEEEVAALRAADPRNVLTDVDGLPGQWVRWRPIGDPADALPNERVYSVDESTGTVTFGDARTGMIPPIGRDNIVAFKYRRTEPLKAAMRDTPPPQVAVSALSSLGVVTPLQGVESVVAVLDSDAGAPPDDAARVLRFAPSQLRHRGRAVSPTDVEALALQATPGIAQARCLRHGNALRLVVVMRGAQIAPARAVKRELERLLLDAMSAGFNAAGSGLAFDIVPPRPRLLRVRAQLRVASLDAAGAVANAAKALLKARFDPATGADDGRGWPLGESPDDHEVEATLIDTPDLDGIDKLNLVEITPIGEQPWPVTLQDDELAVLPDDGLDFTYTLVEAFA